MYVRTSTNKELLTLRCRETVLSAICLLSGAVSPSRLFDLWRVQCPPMFESLFAELVDLTDIFAPLPVLSFCAGEGPLSTASRCFCLLNSDSCPDRCITSSNAFFLSIKSTQILLQLKRTL